MKMFMLKSFIVAALMFISVLTGMEIANNGIHKMKGYDDPNFQNAVSINEHDKDFNATFLGKELSSHDLESKKKKLEEMNAFNFFSSMGKKVSDGLTNGSEKLIRKITE
ncbi:DUF3679 domain-containing protein [Neobacillus kokaensis]|uniref:DUF3679 domain-containing protein n=1 Tax=Neobacillus kokaensis TaxID=2759023 RepID=A0ABQ3MXU2_9BACI|nr:DUF3679 domain-containing protein [Neobacillus kokaensis]GHH97059.1 hypothetical protein AM1BK_06020 [Neobacillus kokaensis]